MDCCRSTSNKGIDKFFSKQARKFEKKLSRKGLEKSQKHLMEGLLKAGIEKRSILEIGCGTGHLHLGLLNQGAESALGVDISKEMIAYAQSNAQKNGLQEKTQYKNVDFLEVHPDIPNHDITILDKVICCYPDMDRLTAESIQKTKRVYAFTLPREKWWVRAPMRAGIAFAKLFKCSFHPYFHPHGPIIERLNNMKFDIIYQNQTFMWATYVYGK